MGAGLQKYITELNRWTSGFRPCLHCNQTFCLGCATNAVRPKNFSDDNAKDNRHKSFSYFKSFSVSRRMPGSLLEQKKFHGTFRPPRAVSMCQLKPASASRTKLRRDGAIFCLCIAVSGPQLLGYSQSGIC